MLVVAGFSLLAIASYEGSLARADSVFWLKYFLSSQSAILWMSLLFFMSTGFYWIGMLSKVGSGQPMGYADTRAQFAAVLAAVLCLVPFVVLGFLPPVLAGGSMKLDIDGARTFGYTSTYLDTPDLVAYHAAAHRRRRRFKVRSRCYDGTGLAFLEVKTRGPRGVTVKERCPWTHAAPTRLRPRCWTCRARRWLASRT